MPSSSRMCNVTTRTDATELMAYCMLDRMEQVALSSTTVEVLASGSQAAQESGNVPVILLPWIVKLPSCTTEQHTKR